MRLSVRLGVETRENIRELKKEMQNSGEYENLKLTNGYILNQAYTECIPHSSNNFWKDILQFNSEIKERQSVKIRTDLQISEKTMEGISELKLIIAKLTNTNYITTSFIIKMIVTGAIFIRKNKKTEDCC